MNEYSEDWRHLKAILTGYATRDREIEIYSYEEQIYAKAFSIFLANAKLATPILDRETVQAVLAGSLQWPRSFGEPFVCTEISLSHLERLGLVSFFAGWCSTHSDTVKDVGAVDSSLAPLVEAINHLKDIRFGRNGCIQPHYFCSELKLRQLLHKEFAGHPSVEKLFTELELGQGNFRLKPGNQNFSSLISTHLWLTLRGSYDPEEAFSHWIMRLRVNCDWAMPVIFDENQRDEKEKFSEQLLKFLSKDAGLSSDLNLYIRQLTNENHFSSLIQPVQTSYQFTIDKEGSRPTSTQTVDLPKPTIFSLEEVYPRKLSEASSHLEFVVSFNHLRMRERSVHFYSWLISSMVDAAIRIQGQHLISESFTEELVKIGDTRPILKYILFIILPRYEHSKYIILLLARPETCDIAFYHLTKQRFEHSQKNDTSYIQNLEDGYQQLVCRQYINSLGKEPDFIPRLLSAIEVLGDQCAFGSSDFSEGFEYRFLLNLLNALDNQQAVQLAQFFANLQVQIRDSWREQSLQHYKYLVGFWLIDRLESSGIDPTGTTCQALRIYIQKYYSAEFAANLKGLRSLEPNAFFATLPWQKIISETGPGAILALSNKCDEWKQALDYKSPHPFDVAAAVSQYIQVLMCLDRSTLFSRPLHTIATRVQEIVRFCGFGPRDQFVQLFDAKPGATSYDIWEQFCTYSNSFSDELYEDFVDRCVPAIPLDYLFILLERCSIIGRERLLHEAIDVRQSYTNDDLSLSALEQAFTSACDAGRTETAAQLLKAAKDILAQERFANSTNNFFVRIRKTWESYDYKWQLLELFEANKSDPVNFEKMAHGLTIPHKLDVSFGQPRTHHEECEYFRRQLIAMAFSDADPEKSVRFMDYLYRQSKRPHHGFVLLYVHIKLFAIDKNKTRLQHALASFLNSAGRVDPEQMIETWVTSILEAYQLLGAPEIDNFWMRLSAGQQTRIHILTPYCKTIIARGDALMARKILTHYQKLNKLTPNDLGIDDLISELSKVEENQPSMSELIQLINEGSQRSTLQLQKHYSQIISRDFESYVEIVKPDQPSHEYLKDAVLAVARELVLRKRNLQVEKSENGNISYQIMLEDLINDWFTSLFDHRMAQARVGFRDQKRGGHSASGKNPGEIDGFITSSDNTRHAIFESFRLFSLDKTVISQHLDKIAGYDAESLSPVFIVGYCDVKNFLELAMGYGPYVSNRHYAGYTTVEGSPGEMTVLYNTDHIWLGMETRRRDRKNIFFYHFLINLHFSPPSAVTSG